MTDVARARTAKNVCLVGKKNFTDTASLCCAGRQELSTCTVRVVMTIGLSSARRLILSRSGSAPLLPSDTSTARTCGTR